MSTKKVPAPAPRPAPEIGLGDSAAEHDGGPFEHPEELPEARYDRLLVGLYEVARQAARAAGGLDTLAARTGKSLTNWSQRLNRAEVKGATQCLPLDYLAAILADPDAAHVWLLAVCVLLGYESPKRRVELPPQVALLVAVRRNGCSRQVLLKAAVDLGLDVKLVDAALDEDVPTGKWDRSAVVDGGRR